MKKGLFRKLTSGLATQETFGLDINSEEIKVFQIRKCKKGHEVVAWNKKVLPQGLVEDFTIKDQAKFAEILLDAISSAHGKKIKTASVVVSLPEDKVFLRVIKIPKMSEDEAGEAIRWELEANIPISIEEVYFDWQIVAQDEKEMFVLVEASPQKVVDGMLASLEETGFIVHAMEADSAATGRSVLGSDHQGPALIVDIGKEGSGYFIFDEGYPVLSSGGSVSGKMFTDTVCKHLNCDFKKAESYKLRVGLGSTKKEREEALGIYKPLLFTLIQEIEKTIDFYNENLSSGKEKEIQEVIICGGASNLKGLIPYLAINLKRKVFQGNPWENVQLKKGIPPISKEEAQSYITVIGLALRDNKDQ